MITPGYSITASERVLPRLALDFTTGALDSRVTITRALNTATRINASGVIEIVNANLPRFDYDPVSLQPKGLLIEPLRVNIQWPSTPTSATGLWATVNSGTQTTGQASPDGGTNATLVTSNGGPESGYRSSTTFAINTTYTHSAYVKANGARYAYIRALSVSNGDAFFDITNGVPATKGASVTTSTITPFGGGWYRITATVTTTGTIANNLWDLRTGNANGAYTSTNGQGMYFYGAQVEVGPNASSFIPTSTGTVTRNADAATMTGTNFSSWWQATSGAVSVKAQQFTVTGVNPWVQFDDTTANNIIALRGNIADPELYIKTTTDQAQIDAGTLAAGSFYGLAGGWTTDNCAAAFNGGVAATDVSATIPVVTQARLGNDGTNYLNGWLQTVRYWPQRLTNAEIQAFSKL